MEKKVDVLILVRKQMLASEGLPLTATSMWPEQAEGSTGGGGWGRVATVHLQPSRFCNGVFDRYRFTKRLDRPRL